MKRFPALVVFIFIFSSCANHSKNDLSAFRTTEDGLSRSSEIIHNQTEILYKNLENKLADPSTHLQGLIWQPRANYIKQLSSEMINYIKELKSNLIKETGVKNNNDEDVLKEDDMKAVKRIFAKQDKGQELFEKLNKYKADMLAIDERMRSVFQNREVLITKTFDSSKATGKDFVAQFFDDIPAVAAIAMLSSFENNVRIMESEFVTYCSYQSCNIIEHYDLFEPIIGMSSTCVKGGDIVEISAGIGAFSSAANPAITINGLTVAADRNAVAIYKFKTPLKIGKYFVPVKIEYTKPDGTKKTVTQNIKYTVAE